MSTVHQFVPVAAVGDGVTGSVFLIRELLRSLGHTSEILTSHADKPLRSEVVYFREFDSASCDLLLVHHSMGHDLEHWLRSTDCPRVLVYHNITPASFFAPESHEYRYSNIGREQLRRNVDLFAGAIAVSPYNCVELHELGYANPTVIPLLVDPRRFDGDNSRAALPSGSDEIDVRIISVGRIAENKRQHLLIEAFWHLKRLLPEKSCQLLIVGGTTSANYLHVLNTRIAELDLADEVFLTGKCSDSELRGLYRAADVMWCASEHEGFCIPLVEANHFSIPVVAFRTSNIPHTLGDSGLLLQESNPLDMAAGTATLLDNPPLIEQLKDAGAKNVERFSTAAILPQIRDYLEPYLSGADISRA